MSHRLLQPPGGTLRYRLRLPVVQPITETIVDGLKASLMPRDALRRAGTSRAMISTSPLPTPQVFALSDVGYTNSPESMHNGLRISNARRLVDKTRGQSAGP